MLGNYPTILFPTYADATAEGALGNKRKYVIIQANENEGGIMTLHFFDGQDMSDWGGGGGVDPNSLALLSRETNLFTGRKIVIQPDPGSPPLVTLGRESTSWYPHIGAHGYAAALGSLLGNDAALSNNAYMLYLAEYRRIAQGFAGLIQVHLGDIIGTVAPGTGPADEDFTDTRRTLFYFGNSGYIAFWGLKDNGDGVLVADNNGAVTKKAAIPRPILPVDEDYNAVAADAGKLISLDATGQAVTLTIDPTLFTGMTLMIRCKANTNGVTIAAATGIIELKSGVDVTDFAPALRQTIQLYSDGENLLEL